MRHNRQVESTDRRIPSRTFDELVVEDRNINFQVGVKTLVQKLPVESRKKEFSREEGLGRERRKANLSFLNSSGSKAFVVLPDSASLQFISRSSFSETFSLSFATRTASRVSKLMRWPVAVFSKGNMLAHISTVSFFSLNLKTIEK